MKRTCLWLLFSVFMVGCASTSMHTPTAAAISDKMLLNEFRTASSVSLINAAIEPDDREWTESVITFLSEQLEQRGAEIVEGSPRQLNLELVKARRITAQILLAPLAAPEGCEVVVMVTTGNGYVQEYPAVAGAYSWQKACDKCVTRAVVDIINDPGIRGYPEFLEDED